ncbi:MAG TPA: HEAT repeat domain-containing protein [Kofleriaceae bacterium]|nr:HEAT repeat domain-containing protein [Kofleriaceae bacterium]
MTPPLARRAVLAPAAVLFTILVAHALLETARDALFLARLGPDRLAWAYIAMASVALLAVAAVRRWGGGRDPRRLLIAFLGVAVVGTAALAATIAAARSAVFVLYVWTGLVATLVVPAFWTVIDRSLRVAEAKQVFGAIGAGGVLGAMVGSAIAGALGRVVLAQHLVTAGALAFGAAAVTAFALVPRVGAAEPPPRQRRVETLSHRSRRYVRLLIIVELVSMIALTFGDLMFKRIVASRIASGDLATAFGAIYTGFNVIGLAIQLVVTPRLLARWGVGNAMMVLPVLLVSTALGFSTTGALALVIALKLGDGGLRNSLHRVGTEILFLPVPAVVRDGWKPIADAVGQRGGQALAALGVFGLAALGAGPQLLGVVTAVAGAVWLVVIAITKRAYVAQFRETLRAGEVERDVRIPDLDADSIELLTESLASPDEVEALAALDLLARRARVPALVLYHPRVAVVQHALSLLEGQLRPDVVRVLGHLIGHPDPKIRAVALAVSSRTGCHRDRLVAAASDAAADVRAVALVGLASDADHVELVVRGITALAEGTTADRAALARALGYAPDARFRPLLYQLLERREPAVMREVLHVLARTPALADLDRLLALLGDPRVRGNVRHVFLSLGRRGLDHLIAALDDPRTPLAIRRHLPRTISKFRGRAAAAALAARLLREPDGTTEYKILRALGRMRADDPDLPVDEAAIGAYARRAVADAARYATFTDQLDAAAPDSPGTALIRELLVEKCAWAFEHAFRALGILHPRAGLRSIHDALRSGNDARHGAAREIVEALVPAELRVPLLAVLAQVPAEQRRALLGELAAGPFASYEAFIAALLIDPSESLRCVVAYHVAEHRLIGLRGDLARLRPLIEPPMVAHAFDQAIARLDA